MAMNWPRDLWSAVSVEYTGTIAFKIPVPQPFTRRAQIIQFAFIAEHCSEAPMMPTKAPKAMPRIRPTLSDSHPPTRQPTRVPR